MRQDEVKSSAITMINEYGKDGYEKVFDKLAYENEICIKVVDIYGLRTIYSNDTIMGKGCLIHGPEKIGEYIMELKNSEQGVISHKIKNPNTQYDTLLLGALLFDNDDSPCAYMLINATLEPVGSTVKILKQQFIYVTCILILIGIIISIIIANSIAKPIVNITHSADKLAKGDYSAEFDGGIYKETHMLANTLNYASNEISKVDTMQRDLIANISHDLRTPLTMVKAYAEMIRDLSGNNPVKREEHLNIIIEETDRLALLVSDMLDLSKMENGNIKLNYSHMNVTAKLREIIDRYKGVSEKNGYTIVFIPDEEVTVSCDIVKIEQVIYNLINNAVNYTGDDRMVYVKQINEKNYVKVEVTDTGEGIPEENIKLIFDKYYRSKNHKREVVGTGLGLSIVKAVLKMHNYPYGVQSTIGKGSTFWFKIKRDENNNK
jgi:signal transduction histidine kinase